MSGVSISRGGRAGGGREMYEWFLGPNLARRQTKLPDAVMTFPCPTRQLKDIIGHRAVTFCFFPIIRQLIYLQSGKSLKYMTHKEINRGGSC